MIALDTNILVYAHREESPFHERAREQSNGLRHSPTAWAIPSPCIHEFIIQELGPRIASFPRFGNLAPEIH